MLFRMDSRSAGLDVIAFPEIPKGLTVLLSFFPNITMYMDVGVKGFGINSLQQVAGSLCYFGRTPEQ